jgi:hypothetical protein
MSNIDSHETRFQSLAKDASLIPRSTQGWKDWEIEDFVGSCEDVLTACASLASAAPTLAERLLTLAEETVAKLSIFTGKAESRALPALSAVDVTIDPVSAKKGLDALDALDAKNIKDALYSLKQKLEDFRPSAWSVESHYLLLKDIITACDELKALTMCHHPGIHKEVIEFYTLVENRKSYLERIMP